MHIHLKQFSSKLSRSSISSCIAAINYDKKYSVSRSTSEEGSKSLPALQR